ncbi:MAG: class I SAM-dependent methyltransferase [Bacteroidota bacterium]
MKICPVCSDASEKRFLSKVNLNYGTEYDLVECPRCAVIYFDPMPTVVQLATFYSAGYYDFDPWREQGKGMAFARQLKKWRQSGRFIDIGCATGFFIYGIKNHSQWEVYGTDFGESAIRFAKEKLGLNAYNGDIADIHFPDEHFDYVHVNNVLEHVPNPVTLLKECHRIVKKDGIFYLSVPNGKVDSCDLIDFYHEEQKPARSKQGHIFFFQDKTLKRLFDEIGFEVIKQETYSVKRGLRSIGMLPRKNDWKKDYFPKTEPEKISPQSEVIVPEKKKHSDLYYQLRFWQGNLQHIPGLHNFGLDFLFLLKKK